jgi:hypothetical protein
MYLKQRNPSFHDFGQKTYGRLGMAKQFLGQSWHASIFAHILKNSGRRFSKLRPEPEPEPGAENDRNLRPAGAGGTSLIIMHRHR